LNYNDFSVCPTDYNLAANICFHAHMQNEVIANAIVSKKSTRNSKSMGQLTS